MEKKINKSVINQINEINRLHKDIVKLVNISVEKAIKIGELLYKQKLNLIHGEFGGWVKKNLIFEIRQAERYMMIYKEQNYVNNLRSNATSMSKLSMNNLITYIRINRSRDIREGRREELAEIGQEQFRLEGYYNCSGRSISESIYEKIVTMIFQITQAKEYIENITDECKATLENYDSYYIDGQSKKPKYVVRELKKEVIKLNKIMQEKFPQIILDEVKKILCGSSIFNS